MVRTTFQLAWVDGLLFQVLFLRRTKLPIMTALIKQKIQLTHNDAMQMSEDDRVKCMIDMQSHVLRCTVQMELLKSFPLPRRYVRDFISQFIKAMEEYQRQENAIPDCIYEELYLILQKCLDNTWAPLLVDNFDQKQADMFEKLKQLYEKDENTGFVTHTLKDPLSERAGSGSSYSFHVSVLDSAELVASGTTGLRTWPAACHLMEFLLQKANGPENPKHSWSRGDEWHHILELGCGPGLIGIGLIKNGMAGQYTFTDHSEAVFDRLKLNLYANNIAKNANVNVALEVLDWEKPYLPDEELPSPDLILASDVIFDPLLVDPLIETIKSIFQHTKKNSGYFPDCLVCCTVRNEELLNQFVAKVRKTKLSLHLLEKVEIPVWNHECFERLRLAGTDLKSHNTPVDINFQNLINMDADGFPTVLYHIKGTSKFRVQ